MATVTSEILLSTDDGLFQYDPELDTVTDIGLEKINVNKIYQPTASHIWALTNKSLFQFRKNKWVGHFKNEGKCLHIDR